MKHRSFENVSKEEEHRDFGNIELTEKGELIARKDISIRDEIENEAQYKESKEWQDALEDFKKTWDNLDLSNLSNEVRQTIHDPEWFVKLIDTLLEKYEVGRVKIYLEQKFFEFEKLRGEFEDARESVVDNMLDFKKTVDEDLNSELKEKFKDRIAWIDRTLAKTNDVIDYIKEKQTELLL